MIQYIFKNKDLSDDFETEYLRINMPSVSGSRSSISANTLEICWRNVAGAMQGQFTIIGSTDGTSPAIGAAINVNKSDTCHDSWIFKIAAYINFIKIIYKSNGTLAGSADSRICFKQ